MFNRGGYAGLGIETKLHSFGAHPLPATTAKGERRTVHEIFAAGYAATLRGELPRC
jgi:hypothetical protein